MIDNNIKNRNEKNVLEKMLLEYKLLINKRLYEQKIISLEIYEKMTERLLNKLDKTNVSTINNKLT